MTFTARLAKLLERSGGGKMNETTGLLQELGLLQGLLGGL
jgi:hypothetical protein